LDENRSKELPSISPSQISEVAIHFDIGWLAKLLLNGTVEGIEDDFEKGSLCNAAHHEGAVLRILLEQDKAMKFIVIHDAVRLIAQRHHRSMMALLLDRRTGDVPITEEVVKAAVGNVRSGKEVIALLLENGALYAHAPISTWRYFCLIRSWLGSSTVKRSWCRYQRPELVTQRINR